MLGGDQQLQQQHGAAAEERDGQRRSVEEVAQGGAGLQLQLLGMNADAQVLAVQGLEQRGRWESSCCRRRLSTRS